MLNEMAKFCDVVVGTVSGDHDEDDGAETLAQKVHTITNAAVTIHAVSIARARGSRVATAIIVWANA